ncbi:MULTISPECIES: SrfA family protein [Dickeya]|uniref:Putative virulence factor,type III effector n=1 Tax=Dickeya aquatica TaxID=1401087 RepID=A0A375AAF6_9GAMM|nr:MULTISPECIES: SrfA family protein [Dickeya]SLM63078.1 putative virulence factor,type III effector [Dickeya aquatica]
MAKLFLRSGNLDDFLALGENGQPVYASALQLRETLRLRQQQHIADCLAIPQPNDEGDRIDWYAPFTGKITSWMAASDEQRTAALTLLEQYLATVDAISERARQSDKPAQKLFGVLLSKAFQFPGSNHVYLVDDKPVVTFWGFVSLGKKSRSDVLECLRPAEPAIIPEPVAEPLPVVTTQDIEPEPEPEPPVPPAPPVVPVVNDAPAAPVGTPPVSASRWTRFWWVAPGAALLVTLVFQIRSCVSKPDTMPSAAVTAIKPEKRVLGPSEPSTSDALPQPNLPLNVATLLPGAASAVEPVPATQENHAAPATLAPTPPAALIPAPKGALVMPADAVKIGSVRFLDGNWQATLQAKNPLTGTPPVFHYQIKGGKGHVRFTYSEGVVCQAEVEAGLHQSGNLAINSRYRARCSDGSRYPMPEIICTRQEASEAAECNGRYDAETVLPMTIKRESK